MKRLALILFPLLLTAAPASALLAADRPESGREHETDECDVLMKAHKSDSTW